MSGYIECDPYLIYKDDEAVWFQVESDCRENYFCNRKPLKDILSFLMENEELLKEIGFEVRNVK